MPKKPEEPRKPRAYGIMIDTPGAQVEIVNPSGSDIDGPATAVNSNAKSIKITGGNFRNTGGVQILKPTTENQPFITSSRNKRPTEALSRTSVGWNPHLQTNWPWPSPLPRAKNVSSPNFFSARLKLERAEKHIAEVDKEIAAFLSSDFYRIASSEMDEEGNIKIIFASLRSPPVNLSALIGDAVGNLRSALDYIAVAMVSPVTGKTKDIGFPFADDSKGFFGRVRAKDSVGHCSTNIKKYFDNEVQAYKGGLGQDLWVLNKLRNIDKHRLLLMIASFVELQAKMVDEQGNVVEARFATKAGGQMTLLDAPQGYKLAQDPLPAFAIEFNEPPFAEGTNAVHFLKIVAAKTTNLLNILKEMTNGIEQA